MARTRTRTFRVVPEDTRSWDLFLKDFLSGLEDVDVGAFGDVPGNSFMGRAESTVGAPASIIATVDGHPLRLSGGVLGFGTLTSSSISNFTTAAQDAAGATLTDTASINFTYGAGVATAVVLPAGVDHDALANFVANKHIDHTAVTLTAGNGLTGGGDISASRTFDVGAGTGITVNANDVALANMADSTIKGRASGAGTGAPTDLTAAQVAAILSISAISSYTPTLTNVTNLDSSAANTTYYIRVRDFVLVFGNLAANATAAAATQLDISLPVASAIQSSIDLGGVGFCGAVAGFGAAIVGESVNDRASMTWIATDTNNRSIAFIFGYRII